MSRKWNRNWLYQTWLDLNLNRMFRIELKKSLNQSWQPNISSILFMPMTLSRSSRKGRRLRWRQMEPKPESGQNRLELICLSITAVTVLKMTDLSKVYFESNFWLMSTQSIKYVWLCLKFNRLWMCIVHKQAEHLFNMSPPKWHLEHETESCSLLRFFSRTTWDIYVRM